MAFQNGQNLLSPSWPQETFPDLFGVPGVARAALTTTNRLFTPDVRQRESAADTLSKGRLGMTGVMTGVAFYVREKN